MAQRWLCFYIFIIFITNLQLRHLCFVPFLLTNPGAWFYILCLLSQAPGSSARYCFTLGAGAPRWPYSHCTHPGLTFRLCGALKHFSPLTSSPPFAHSPLCSPLYPSAHSPLTAHSLSPLSRACQGLLCLASYFCLPCHSSWDLAIIVLPRNSSPPLLGSGTRGASSLGIGGTPGTYGMFADVAQGCWCGRWRVSRRVAVSSLPSWS